MLDKYQIVHDLALVYAQEHYREFLHRTPEEKRKFLDDANKLADLYEQGVLFIANHADKILKAYQDDGGHPILGD